MNILMNIFFRLCLFHRQKLCLNAGKGWLHTLSTVGFWVCFSVLVLWVLYGMYNLHNAVIIQTPSEIIFLSSGGCTLQYWSKTYFLSFIWKQTLNKVQIVLGGGLKCKFSFSQVKILTTRLQSCFYSYFHHLK